MARGVSSAVKDRTRPPTWETIGTRTVTTWAPVFGWVTRYVSIMQSVRVLKTQVYPVRWYRFAVAGDERTCPECNGANGTSWPEDSGAVISPPLHVNCRCQIVLDRIELRRREVWGWEQRTKQVAIQDWEQIGTRTNRRVEEVKGWKYAN